LAAVMVDMAVEPMVQAVVLEEEVVKAVQVEVEQVVKAIMAVAVHFILAVAVVVAVLVQ
jgi:hypothetical protein